MAKKINRNRATKDYLTLLDYTVNKPYGAVLDYLVVTQETGIPMMDRRHRDMLRRAIDASGRKSKTIPSVGYELESPQNAEEISTGGGQSLTRHVKRVLETTVTLLEHHEPNLDVVTRETLIYRREVLKLEVSSTKRLLVRKKPPQITQHSDTISIP